MIKIITITDEIIVSSSVATPVVVIILLLCTVIITAYCTVKCTKRKECQDNESGQDIDFSTGHTGYLKRTVSANNPIALVVLNQGCTNGETV